MEKVLLLSCSTGQGHNSCAEAIKEYFEAQTVSCECLDALEFISKRFARFLSWGHSFMYRYVPGLFRWGYQLSETHSEAFQEGAKIYRIMASGADALYRHILDGQFDTVICTHVFAAMMLTHCLKVHPMPVRTAFVATDHTCYPGLDACNLQYHFVSDDNLAGYYIQCGASPAHVIASGIPVRQEFWSRTDKRTAKERLGISPEHEHLLIMGGSMGAGPMSKLLKGISKRLAYDMEVSVLCGTNWELQRRLLWQYSRDKNIHIRGYTDQMSLYLDSADLYLTKPGGISITEAAVKCVPMAFINAVAGCELYNMDYFVQMGAAICADSPTELAERSAHLLHSPGERHRMERALREHLQFNGAERIFQSLNEGDEKNRYGGLSSVQAQSTERAGI